MNPFRYERAGDAPTTLATIAGCTGRSISMLGEVVTIWRPYQTRSPDDIYLTTGHRLGNGAPSMARHGARSAVWSPPKATSRWDERPGLSTALREGLRPVEQIRQAVGNQMEIAIEGHARWNLPIALRTGEARACRLFAGSITSGGD